MATFRFIDFEWDQSAGADDGEVLRPAFPQQKADAFSEKECRVKEGSHAEQLELTGVDVKGAREDLVDVVVFGIDAQGVDPMFESTRQIVMEETQSSQGDGEQ